MARDGTVLEHTVCPNCQSQTAQLQAFLRSPEVHIVAVLLVCKICRLRQAYGFTTYQGVQLWLYENRLREQLEKCEDPKRQYEIEQKLREIAVAKEHASLGLT